MNYKAELVFATMPDMGHLLSAAEMAKRILATNENMSISIHIMNFQVLSHQVTAYIEYHSSKHNRLNFVTFPPLPNPPDVATDILLLKPLLIQAVEHRTSSGFPKPIAFILDIFCINMLEAANELNLPSYIFLTGGAGILNLNYFAQSLFDDQGIDFATLFSQPDYSTAVPGFVNPVPSKVIPWMFQDKNFGAAFILNLGRRFRETKGILMNTFEELESYAIKTLLDSTDKTIPPVYPVGPIIELNSKSRGSWSLDGDDSIMEWLNRQPKSSVAFVCFGSNGTFDEEQVFEIANGLDQSGYRFLWTLRKPAPQSKTGPPDNNEVFMEALPKGFLDRTADRGKIIAWAPQLEVLGHPAVGGFVSHCGWNSILESLWLGVPIATFPFAAEQQLNAFSLVKEYKLAVEVRMDYRRDMKLNKANFVVKAEEIATAVNKLMNMDEEMRRRVKEMSDISRKVLDDGGSSHKWLRRFIQNVLSGVA